MRWLQKTSKPKTADHEADQQPTTMIRIMRCSQSSIVRIPARLWKHMIQCARWRCGHCHKGKKCTKLHGEVDRIKKIRFPHVSRCRPKGCSHDILMLRPPIITALQSNLELKNVKILPWVEGSASTHIHSLNHEHVITIELGQMREPDEAACSGTRIAQCANVMNHKTGEACLFKMLCTNCFCLGLNSNFSYVSIPCYDVCFQMCVCSLSYCFAIIIAPGVNVTRGVLTILHMCLIKNHITDHSNDST